MVQKQAWSIKNYRYVGDVSFPNGFFETSARYGLRKGLSIELTVAMSTDSSCNIAKV
jgi:hypothetical protein